MYRAARRLARRTAPFARPADGTAGELNAAANREPRLAPARAFNSPLLPAERGENSAL